MNCSVSPLPIPGLPGLNWIETNCAALTVKWVLPDTLPRVAEMVVVPTPAVVARPLEPIALLIVAAVGFDEAQVTWLVRSCAELSV